MSKVKGQGHQVAWLAVQVRPTWTCSLWRIHMVQDIYRVTTCTGRGHIVAAARTVVIIVISTSIYECYH